MIVHRRGGYRLLQKLLDSGKTRVTGHVWAAAKPHTDVDEIIFGRCCAYVAIAEVLEQHYLVPYGRVICPISESARLR